MLSNKLWFLAFLQFFEVALCSAVRDQINEQDPHVSSESKIVERQELQETVPQSYFQRLFHIGASSRRNSMKSESDVSSPGISQENSPTEPQSSRSLLFPGAETHQPNVPESLPEDFNNGDGEPYVTDDTDDYKLCGDSISLNEVSQPIDIPKKKTWCKESPFNDTFCRSYVPRGYFRGASPYNLASIANLPVLDLDAGLRTPTFAEENANASSIWNSALLSY